MSTMQEDHESSIASAYMDHLSNEHDTQLLWTGVRAEGWLITAITQLETDGLYLTACDLEHWSDEHAKSPFLASLFAHVQRNTLFYDLGLSHRFIALVEVSSLPTSSSSSSDRSTDPFAPSF